jgi:predicted nucleotide-binding protein
MLKRNQAVGNLEELKGAIPSLAENPSVRHPEFKRWRHKFDAAIRHIFPQNPKHLDDFRNIRFVTDIQTAVTTPGANDRAFRAGLEEADCLLHALIDEIRKYWADDGTSLNPQGQETAGISSPREAKDSKRVFVVHGRNEAMRKSMFAFLRAIGLTPIEWSQAREATKDPNPYVGHILRTAFSDAQAFVVVMTPDDEAWLKAEFRNENDPSHETQLTGQPRQNVLFESGMAMGYDPKRTVLVEIGALRPFSDIFGRHTVRLDDTFAKRQELANRLKSAGCEINLSGTDWHTAGSFQLPESAANQAKSVPKRGKQVLKKNKVCIEAKRVEDKPRMPGSTPYCQIQVKNVPRKRIESLEVLLSWNHPDVPQIILLNRLSSTDDFPIRLKRVKTNADCCFECFRLPRMGGDVFIELLSQDVKFEPFKTTEVDFKITLVARANGEVLATRRFFVEIVKGSNETPNSFRVIPDDTVATFLGF